MPVLDVGRGDGTTALPLAMLGAEVTGVESHVLERFGQAGVVPEKISLVKDTFTFQSATSGPAHLGEQFRKYYGPTMNAFEAVEKAGETDELHGLLMDLAKSQNTVGAERTAISATVMRVTVSA